MKTSVQFLLKQLGKQAKPFFKSFGLMQTTKVYATTAITSYPGKENVVVLAPHMDDEVIECGGPLAPHAAAGSNITVIFLTDGRYGSHELSKLTGKARLRAENELVATRKQEAHNALRVLGIDQIHFLDAEDGKLSSNRAVAVHLRS